MNLPLDPIKLALQYLLMLFTGTSYDTLLSNFISADKAGNFSEYFPNQNTGLDTFDFIIVGGGTAGCVLANRLSASPKNRVLLIEAGGNPFPLTAIPSLAGTNLNHDEIDWGFTGVPQTHSFQAHINNTPIYNRGKGLGGSGFLNFLMYMRGNPHDFDNWANLTGDSSWSYANVAPIFKNVENYFSYFPNETFHGRGGPVELEKQGFPALQKEWLESGEKMGYKVHDANAYQQAVDTNTKNGARFTTYNGYLHPVLNRPNLEVYTYSHVAKIHLNNKRKAVSVAYTRDGKSFVVKATKEIILSAGTIGSPQILMLSGVGPKEHLESLGISVKVDLHGVGQNLQDHLVAFAGPVTVKEGASIMTEREFNQDSLQQYLGTQKGPLSGFMLNSGFLLETSRAKSGWPDMYFAIFPIGMGRSMPGEMSRELNFKADYLDNFIGKMMGNDSFWPVAVLSLPKSRGEIRLKSADPFDHPIIDSKYLSHPDDIRVLVEGIQTKLKIIKTAQAYQKVNAKLSSTPVPGCEHFGETISDEYWECYARHLSGSMYHICGTCRMGSGWGDDGAVVDSQLRVIGTIGLRVIDASIMPQIPNTNTYAPVIMIAEKGAAMIVKYWTKREEQATQ